MTTLDVDGALASAVVDVRRRFFQYVERDELNSIGWVWLLEHEGTLNGYKKDENPKRAFYRLRRDLMMSMETYARGEKAASLGYSALDEEFYSRTLVGALLPAILSDDYDQPQVQSDGRGKSDPAESGTWMARRSDVARAWEETVLSDQEREAVILHYGFGYVQDEIAEQAGVSQQQVSNRLRSAVQKLVTTLGGDRPKGCPFDCECHEAPLNRRPGIHSRINGTNQELQ
jgi:RNA polymerase sigma factor (sigma-70 family)